MCWRIAKVLKCERASAKFALVANRPNTVHTRRADWCGELPADRRPGAELGAVGRRPAGVPPLCIAHRPHLVAGQGGEPLVDSLVALFGSRMGFDPALAGGVILTTVTDVMGFLSFLGLATAVLLH